MPCERIPVAGGVAFACSRGPARPRCSSCGAPSTKLCDYPLRGAKAGQTCDRQLCAACARRWTKDLAEQPTDRPVAGGFDLCPAHFEIARKGATP